MVNTSPTIDRLHRLIHHFESYNYKVKPLIIMHPMMWYRIDGEVMALNPYSLPAAEFTRYPDKLTFMGCEVLRTYDIAENNIYLTIKSNINDNNGNDHPPPGDH